MVIACVFLSTHEFSAAVWPHGTCMGHALEPTGIAGIPGV